MEEAELSLERRPGAGPAPPPGVEVSTAGLLAVRSSRLPLVPPLDFRELFRLETRFRFSMSESRMGAGVPPPPPPAVLELLCGDSRDSRDRDRRITANDDLSNLHRRNSKSGRAKMIKILCRSWLTVQCT
jgi:hypothetical protein